MPADRRFFVLQVVGAWILAVTVAGAATTQPSTQPSVETKTFQSTTANIRFKYPGDWKKQKAATAIFNIVAPANRVGSASLSLDVPSLPPAIFCGIITPKMVENGYVKDLRKNQMHDARVEESVELKLPLCRARRVKCSGHADGKVAIDVAVLVVHANRIYIFSCDSDRAGYSDARAALDEAVASIQWIK